MSLLTALTSAIKVAGLIPSAVRAVKSVASLFSGSASPNNSAETNRHGAASGAARNAASDATERAEHERKYLKSMRTWSGSDGDD